MRANRITLSTAALLLLLGSTRPRAQEPWYLQGWSASKKNAKENCSDAKQTKKWSDIEGCGVSIYTFKPPGPQVGNVAPGGSIGLGLGLNYVFNRPSSSPKPDQAGTEYDLTARALYSFTNFYLMEGRFDFKMPAIGQADERNRHRFEDQIVLSAFISRLNLAKQDFYGIGPSTSLSGLAVYRQLQDRIGASADWPILSWFGAGGAVQWLSPDIKGDSGSSLPSVGQIYSDSEAPGIFHQPSFMNYQASLAAHTPTKARQTWNQSYTQLTYERFTDLGTGSYSFSRVSGFANTSFDIRHDTGPKVERRSWKNAFCDPEAGGRCSFGSLRFTGLVTASYVGKNQSVPFYFQPTLGGTDINGIDTLRGLVDYRLRAPNRELLQADFDHTLFGPIGIYGFYDVGQVAMVPSDLRLSSLRHDTGVGLYLKVQNTIVFRAFIGFGAGEGSHPNYKFPSVLDSPSQF